MKKVMMATVALVAAASLFVGCNKKEGGTSASAAKGSSSKTTSGSSSQGKVLNIYAWNEEFQSRFNDYYAAKNPKALEGVRVNWVITPNEGNAYQNKLDEDLLRQDSVSADQKIDIFLVEADYALKYVDTPFTLDVKKAIGLTDANLSKQYKYTQDVMTDSSGVLKGVTWQACPAGFVYRRSIANDVLGTDDPEQVQNYLSDWPKFDGVAAQAAAKGYKMISGYDDDFRVFSDNVKSPWVVNGKITIDPAIYEWIAQTKTYTDKGYNNRTSLWTPDWTAGMMGNAKVFGYFGPAWFIDFSMPHGEGSAEGDWAFCKGPQGFSWGGTWVCGAAGSDNIDLIKDIMYTLTCDTATMTEIATKAGDFTNNEDAMTTVANGSYKNDFLGGQNHVKFFLDSAKSIDKSNITAYDQGMTEKIQAAMKEYFDGNVDEATAWDNFYKSINELYPNLTR